MSITLFLEPVIDRVYPLFRGGKYIMTLPRSGTTLFASFSGKRRRWPDGVFAIVYLKFMHVLHACVDMCF
jgi:hypothetical protein